MRGSGEHCVSCVYGHLNSDDCSPDIVGSIGASERVAQPPRLVEQHREPL